MLQILNFANLEENQLEQIKEIVKFYEENHTYPNPNAEIYCEKN